jgi:predicted dehydrogenase
MRTAAAKGLRVGCAPDTVLGASIQEARRLIDSGAIGKPVLGVASVMGHGMEHWHPNPGFFFRPGGGPVLDMGPYYVTTLVTLLGPVASVAAVGQIAFKERVVSTPGSPILGQSIKVETLTSAQGMLEFESGAQITFLSSWDVWNNSVLPIELYGETGSMRVPDPNWFGGDISMSSGRGEWSTLETKQQRFGQANWPRDKPAHANYRGLGLAEMARAISDKRPHRANGDLALHVLAIMVGILEAATERRHVKIVHPCERPAALGESEAKALLA